MKKAAYPYNAICQLKLQLVSFVHHSVWLPLVVEFQAYDDARTGKTTINTCRCQQYSMIRVFDTKSVVFLNCSDGSHHYFHSQMSQSEVFIDRLKTYKYIVTVLTITVNIPQLFESTCRAWGTVFICHFFGLSSSRLFCTRSFMDNLQKKISSNVAVIITALLRFIYTTFYI